MSGSAMGSDGGFTPGMVVRNRFTTRFAVVVLSPLPPWRHEASGTCRARATVMVLVDAAPNRPYPFGSIAEITGQVGESWVMVP